jgi:hypothetical protein
MYILNDLAKSAQDEKLRVTARTGTRGQAYAGRRSGSYRGLAGLRIPHVLRARRAAQAC